MLKKIEAIVNPGSIAVIGASNREGSVGRAVFRNILLNGYSGILYPVNPRAGSVMSVRANKKIEEVPGEVDMAVIIVPAETVPQVMEEAAAKEVKGVIVITAGFKETGGKGAELEDKIRKIARDKNIRLIGPNCLGVINTDKNITMNASFATKMPAHGNIAFISQSGAICTAVLDFADGRNIGFSKFISFGNKADINEIDLIRYLKDDPETDVICMYLEDISDGRAFIDTAREVTWEAGKPMIAIKSGRSAEGARAVGSHTGSLAGSDAAYDAVFFQSGIQRVENINELFNYAVAYSRQPIPKGRNIAIVTNAGGPGILATDAAVRHELTLAEFSDSTKQALKEHLPPAANINNPVDIIGDAGHERYKAALSEIIKDDNVHGVVVILTPQAMTDVLETAEDVPGVARDTDVPILTNFMGIVDVSEGVRYLENHGIPDYRFPDEAIRAMSSMVRFGELLRLEKRCFVDFDVDRDRAEELINEKTKEHEKYMMPENEANEILKCYGFPLLKGVVVEDEDEVREAIREIGLPVAMKISSPDIIHKFDAGGVRLKINSEEDALRAYNEIMENISSYKPGARINGILVEEMAKGGTEVIVGATREPNFGPMCMFGLGGTFVEAIKDVSFRLAPMWEISADIMIRSIKTYRILQGTRGNPPADIKAIKDCILRLSKLVVGHPRIAELDINPLIVYPEGEGCIVADSRMLVTRSVKE